MIISFSIKQHIESKEGLQMDKNAIARVEGIRRGLTEEKKNADEKRIATRVECVRQ